MRTLRDLAAEQEFFATWRRLSLWEKAELFNPWLLVGMVGTLLVGVYCAVQLATGDVVGAEPIPRVVLAAGAALVWLSYLQFFEFDPRYYAAILTLKNAGPRLFRLLIGVLPFFIAFGMFGMGAFGAVEPRFNTFSMTYITLFAFMNGDAFRETYVHTEWINSAALNAVSQLYLYTFIFVFLVVTLKMLVAINEEAFFASRPHGIDVHDGRLLPIMLRALLDRVSKDSHIAGEHASDPLYQSRWRTWFTNIIYCGRR